MSHQHDHDHHFQQPGSARTRLLLSALITLVFVVFEALAGAYSNSLALLTDAAHNLTDFIALGLSWYALRLTTQPSHAGKTFGYHRAGILAALVNSSTLMVMSIGIFYEAYLRALHPPAVAADVLITVGAAALAVNLVTAWLVSHGSAHDLNIRSAFIHLLGDIFSTIGAVLAGVGIWLTGMNWLDPAASALIGLLIVWNAYTILRETVDILLESTPSDIDMSLIVRDFLQVEGVRGVHDLHVWSISKSLRILSAHVVTDDISLSQSTLIQHEIHEIIGQNHGIDHITLQLECEGCDPDKLYCDIVPTHRHGHGQAVKL